MSEKENIQDSSKDGELETGNKPPDSHREASPTDQKQETTNQKQETGDMEIHGHHLHKAPSHGWKHYVFEFLMLFLAVFCGFIAENIREHEVERRREKEFMVSLVADLKQDIANVDADIHSHQAGIGTLDTLFTILNDQQLIKSNGDEMYYAARMGPRVMPLVNNSRTFDQLKNSGSFRLIHELEVSNKIMDYYALFPMLPLLENTAITEFQDYKSGASKLFDPVIFHRQEDDSGWIRKGNDNPPLRSYDAELIKQLEIYIVYINGSRRGLIQMLDKIRTNAETLVTYLEEHYRLK
jgi:hypothetical protein